MIYADMGYSSSHNTYCPVLQNEQVRECIDKNEKLPENCWNSDLDIDKAKEKLKDNSYTLDILKDNCYMLEQEWFHDITGDGTEELVMLTRTARCYDCDERRLYILKDNEIIFDVEKEGLLFRPAEDYNGFIIQYPLKWVGNPECCPTEGLMESYNTFSIGGDFVRFDKFDTRSFQYE